MVDRSLAKRVRDFGCGELFTVAGAGSASLHYFARDASHPSPHVEHAYPSHSLIFTDRGEWQYHGADPRSTVDGRVLVAGMGLHHYACSHPNGVPNECFIVALDDDAFDGDGDRLFAKSVVGLTPEMLLHRRAIATATGDPERLESLAFSLYDAVARTGATQVGTTAPDVRMIYAKRVIQELSTQPITIAAIAREIAPLAIHVHGRRFLAHEGTSPTRVYDEPGALSSHLKEQLRATTLRIEEIAALNGFGSIAHFSAAFRRIVGYAPTAYRRLSAR